MEQKFDTLTGTAFIKMEPLDINALSRDALLLLVFRSRAIVGAIATLGSATAEPIMSVADVLELQPMEITAALSAQNGSSTSSFNSSILSSEPLPWRPNTRPKLPPGALLDIAQGPLWDIMTEWLPFESVCHLDSALCNKSRRPEFLELLATDVLLYNREIIDVLKDGHLTTTKHRPLGAAALSWVLKRGIHLASLYLHNVYSLSSTERESIRESVASLALDGRLNKLETVNFFDCSYIKDADLEGVLLKCYKSVKTVDIRGCRGISESTAVHVKLCTKLEAFAANGNESAADLLEIFQACRILRKISLRAFSFGLTDEVVLSVAEHCRQLEHLDIESCSEVKNSSLQRVAKSCKKLQFVDFTATKITDSSVDFFCSNCPHLKRMYIDSCYVTDKSILSVAAKLPGITHISLGSPRNAALITSSALESLASKCRELVYINLNDCQNIINFTIAKLAEHCPKLEEVYVCNCEQVTAVGLTYLAARCCKLTMVYGDLGQCDIDSLGQIFPKIEWE